MLKTYLHIALIAIFCFISSFTQLTLANPPRLTVVVLVDGLRQDNLDMLRPYWQQGGLRTLSEEAYQTTFTFPHEVYGGNETTATIMTGVTPSQHGFAMEQYFARSDRKAHYLLDDPTQKGINYPLALSPIRLFAPTIGDQWRMRIGAQAKIYAIGLHPETAILMAGHSANACCWLNSERICWASTSYYTEGLPSAADKMNTNGRLTELAAKHWTPRLAITSYMSPTVQETRKPFDYLPSDCLLTTPTANTMVIELALALQQDKHLGSDQVPDILLLELTTRTPQAAADKIQSAEQEDMYLWLNQDLGFLMQQLEKRVGKTNFNIVVLGRPVLGIGKQTMEMAGLSVHELDISRMAALTSTYLMALYGHERWVDGCHGNTLYLNHALIEQRKISLATIQRQVADFLMEFEGIQTAFPINEALLHPAFMQTINKHNMGDVIFAPLPGWQLYANDHQPIDYVLDTQPTAPLLFWSSSFLSMPDGKLSATDIKALIL